MELHMGMSKPEHARPELLHHVKATRSNVNATKFEVSQYFPKQFNFFNLGMLLEVSKKPSYSATQVILFQLSGDEDGWCIVTVKSKFKLMLEAQSMVVEIANILVSKFVNYLVDSTGVFIEMSSPRLVDLEHKPQNYLTLALKNLDYSKAPQKTYQYIDKNKTSIELQMYYFKSLQGVA